MKMVNIMSQQSTILIADDEEIIRIIIEGLLSSQGHNLAFAGNGKEALAKATELIPDLILLDVMMPDMDGFEVCERLRADPVLAEVPIIMITALDDRDSRLQGIKAGADDFITKPFDGVELQARIQTITRLNRYRRLLTERHRFEWVVEQDKDGYLILDETGRILYANPQVQLYLNLISDNPNDKGETFLELAQKQYQCEPEAAWQSWPQPTNTPRYLVRPESTTADAVWLQVDLMQMSAGSQETLIRLHDISANVMVQRLMWTFHEQIHHKLRTPLSKLTGFLSLLIYDEATLTEADKKTALISADKGAQQLQQEILSVFQYMDSLNKKVPSHAYCNLAQIPAIIEAISATLEINALNLNQTMPAQPENIRIPTSRQTLEMILWEIIQNARKFHPEESPAVNINISALADEISIQISDNGLTLPSEQLAKMWIPYYQVEKGFSGQVPGMGLGLAMVASLMWNIGGACRSYNNDNGPGITVELKLPFAP